ncbi:MAG: NAD(P)-binding domain-containing protein [Pseudomonadota bacterium]|nr:NAD(P)-binding domain-containing protein [Pseudomonadota bacterium]
MAFVVHGAGAIGGIVAARLHQAGQEVVIIARGANRDALARNGLRLQSETQDWRGAIRVVGHPRDISIEPTDVVILAMKSQDTLAAIEDLAAVAPADTPIVCAQNGVENERIALRWFQNVYGVYVLVFGSHLAPGVVQSFTAPSFGVLDIGRYPRGVDDTARRVAEALVQAGFDSIARSDIMPWKYAKLIANLGNALEAAYGDLGGVADLYESAQAEGRACYRAAGIDWVGAEESAERYRMLLPLKRVNGEPFPGGSTWQSLARGAGHTEVNYLNGEIVMLGRLHGVQTPVNSALRTLVAVMADQGAPPASLNPNEFRARLAAAG